MRLEPCQPPGHCRPLVRRCLLQSGPLRLRMAFGFGAKRLLALYLLRQTFPGGAPFPRQLHRALESVHGCLFRIGKADRPAQFPDLPLHGLHPLQTGSPPLLKPFRRSGKFRAAFFPAWKPGPYERTADQKERAEQPAFKRQGDRPEPQESYFQHAAKDGPGNPEPRQYGTEHDKSRAGFRPGSGPMLGTAGFGIGKAHMFHSQPGQGGT